MVLKTYIEHGSTTTGLCANFQNDLTAEMDALDERNFERFQFKMKFRRMTKFRSMCRTDM